MTGAPPWPSVNALAMPLVRDLTARAGALGITVERRAEGYTLVDAGIAAPGGIEAGLCIAEICMAGLGRVTAAASSRFEDWTWSLNVASSHPVAACLASQYAGWSLGGQAGPQEEAFHALGSGPGRALALKEPLFDELGYRDQAESTVLVLEVDRVPPAAVVEKVLRDCGVAADGLTLILTPTTSLAGATQVVARVLEVALHKAHELGFPLSRIVEGAGCAPLPPPAPSFLAAMGRTNDAIIFGGWAQLYVSGPDDEAESLAADLPSGRSRDYGKPFAEVFKSAKGDFYAIDPMLFSPARVVVTALESGRSFQGGAFDEALLNASFAS